MSKRSANEQETPSKRRKTDYAEDVILLIGKDEKRVVVHKNILCTTSKFFQAALSRRWRETQKKPLKLKEADPDAFLVYVNWLYTGEVDVLHDEEGCTKVGHPACEAPEALASACILGDFLGDSIYCNAVTDKLHELCLEHKITPGLEFVRDYWSSLPKHSGFRRLVLDCEASWVSTAAFDAFAHELPQDFLAEIVKIWVHAPGLQDVEFIDSDFAHYHDKVEEIQKQKPKAKSGASKA